MESKQHNSQLQQAEKFFAAGKRDVAPRSTFADELEQRLVEKYITSYQASQMSEQKFNLPAWAMGAFGAAAAFVAIFAILSFAGGGIPFLNPTNSNGSSSSTGNLPAVIAGELAYVEGATEYQRGQDGWKTAEAGTTLEAGDSVRTFADARAIINLDDGSALRLNGNSEITLTQLDPNKIVVANNSGEVYARVAKLDREFSVVASELTYQSLGTAYTTLNTSELKGVKVFHSKVKVEDKSATDFEKVVSEGEEFYKQNKKNKQIEGKVDKLELSEIKKDAFALWNKEQDEKAGTSKEDLGKLSDLVAPKLTISSPKVESTTDKSKVTVKGATEEGALVYVNGKQVDVQAGNFSKEVSLSEGLNKITVKAMDANGNTASQTLKVTYNNPNSGSDTPTADAGIVITSVTQLSNGIKVQWQVNGGLSTSQGFKVVYNKTGNPQYGVDPANYYDKGTDRAGLVEKKDGATYYIRVCRYTGSGCDNYSNQVTKKAPAPASSQAAVTSISLSQVNSTKISWSVLPGNPDGQVYKVLYSADNSAPTYPANYVTAVSNLYYYEGADLAAGYWRVCAYVNGSCNVYSNVLNLP